MARPDASGLVGFDPASFQISVVMNFLDGVRLPLWMKGMDDGEAALSVAIAGAAGAVAGLGGASASGGGDFSYSAADLVNMDLPIVESASIELSLGLVGKVTIEVATTYELGLKLLDSPFFTVGNTVEVRIGYPRSQRFTPWSSAITQKPSIRITPDEGLTATINATGDLASLRGVSNRVYTGVSYREIIAIIAKRHDWDVEFPGDTLETTVANIEFDQSRSKVSQSQRSDWFMVQHLCYSSGCNAYLGPSEDRGRLKLFIKLRSEAFAASPKALFRSRGQSNFVNTFPLLEFESEAEFVWLSGGSLKTSAKDIDPDNKEFLSFDATAATSADTALGSAGSPNAEKQKVESVSVSLADTEDADRTGEFFAISSRDPRGVNAVVQSHRDQLATRGGVTATATSFGVPELLPGDVVQLDAIGIFNGLYALNGMTHKASDTEWTMEMELLNNAAAAGFIQKHFLTPPDEEKTNNETVDEEEGEDASGLDVEPEAAE